MREISTNFHLIQMSVISDNFNIMYRDMISTWNSDGIWEARARRGLRRREEEMYELKIELKKSRNIAILIMGPQVL